MPNVLDAAPLRALARRAARKIADRRISERFERLAFRRLLDEPRNFRPARDDEIALGPDWARAAHARGETVSVFKPNRALANRLHVVARRLAHTCEVAHGLTADYPICAAHISAAQRFLDKFDRVSFDTAAIKALHYSRLRAEWEANQDAVEVCPQQTIAATMGRSWERVPSVARLQATGREFHNCLAASSRASSYAAMLRRGIAQFWVLRGPDGAGLVVAMASLLKDAEFIEVKGPRNARINLGHPDLALLGAAIGVAARPPPPPTPPPPLPQFISAPTRSALRGAEIDLIQARLRLVSLLRTPLRRRA